MNLDELNSAIVKYLGDNQDRTLEDNEEDFRDGQFDALWRVHLAITRNDIKHLFPFS